MKKHIPHSSLITLLTAAYCLLILTSCHKTCTCIDYNQIEHTFTADEVDARGVTCPNMIYQAGVQYFSVCSWD